MKTYSYCHIVVDQSSGDEDQVFSDTQDWKDAVKLDGHYPKEMVDLGYITHIITYELKILDNQ